MLSVLPDMGITRCGYIEREEQNIARLAEVLRYLKSSGVGRAQDASRNGYEKGFVAKIN